MNVERRMSIEEWWNRLGLRSSSYDPTRRSVVLKWTEYLKSKIRIPKSKIWFLKFLFFDQTGCPLAGGRRSCETIKVDCFDQ